MDVKDIVNDDLTLVEGWQGKIEGFKEAIGDSKYFDTVKDLPGLLKDVGPLSKMKGRQYVPGKDASQDEWDKFNASLPGALKEGEDYNFEFKDFTDAQRAAADKPGVMDTLKEIMRKSGVSQTKAAKMATEYVNKLVEHETKINESKTKETERLKTKWGDNFTKNESISVDARDRFLSTDQRDFLKEAGIIDHPVMKEILYDIGARIQPGRILPGDPATRTPEKKSLAKSLGVV